MYYDSISAGYDAQTAAIWESLNTPQCECCSNCHNYIPLALASHTEIDYTKVFCSKFCLDEWVDENSWEYE